MRLTKKLAAAATVAQGAAPSDPPTVAAPAAAPAAVAPAAAAAERRRLRPRVSQRLVDEHPLLDELLGDENGAGGGSPELDLAKLRSLVEREAPAASLPPAAHPSQLSTSKLLAAGLRAPLLVPAGCGGVRGASGASGAAATRAALGLRLPPAAQLTPRGLAAALGAGVAAPTIDVATQDSGPRLSLGQLAHYLEQQEQEQQEQQQLGRLLNVVSLSLADTALEVRGRRGAGWRGWRPQPERLVLLRVAPCCPFASPACLRPLCCPPAAPTSGTHAPRSTLALPWPARRTPSPLPPPSKSWIWCRRCGPTGRRTLWSRSAQKRCSTP